MAIIQSGATADQLTIDPTSKAARVTLYDTLNNPLANTDRGPVVPGSEAGIQMMGADYKTSRMIRATASGALHTAAEESLLLYDSIESTATADPNKWNQTASVTGSYSQSSVAGQAIFNFGNVTTSGFYVLNLSARRFPFILRAALIFRSRVRTSAHSTGNIIELGFGTPSAATAGIADGACWRKDGTGQWIPVLSIGGSEFLGTGISDATFRVSIAVTDFAIYEIFLEGQRAKFSISDSLGNSVTEQYIDLPTSVVAFTSTHLNGFHRLYNSSATGIVVQMFVAGTTILGTDALLQSRPWNSIMSGMGYTSLANPLTYVQITNYANSTVPTTATLSNTAAGYTNLGGQFQFAAVAGSETDYALFAFQVPNFYTLYLTDVSISMWNTGAATATTSTIFQWSIGINSTAVGLNTTNSNLATTFASQPYKITLGQQNFQIGAAIGAVANDIYKNFVTPLAVQPNRFAHLILKMPTATATASEVFRGIVSFGGYFE